LAVVTSPVAAPAAAAPKEEGFATFLSASKVSTTLIAFPCPCRSFTEKMSYTHTHTHTRKMKREPKRERSIHGLHISTSEEAESEKTRMRKMGTDLLLDPNEFAGIQELGHIIHGTKGIGRRQNSSSSSSGRSSGSSSRRSRRRDLDLLGGNDPRFDQVGHLAKDNS